jgi:DNA-binding NarL/FixJ family response regulator
MADAFIRSPHPKAVEKTVPPRHTEVLQLLPESHSMKQVGAVLSLTPCTEAFHKYRIMDVLNVTSTAELVEFAVRHNVLGA